MQIVTGIFLTMNYKPDAAYAFGLVEYIMRDVDWGWRHALDWRLGVLRGGLLLHYVPWPDVRQLSRKATRADRSSACWIYLALMAEAFGYTRRRGARCRSGGAQVIVNIFRRSRSSGRSRGVDPRATTPWRRHAEPLLRVPRDRPAAGAAGLVVAHLIALHETGSNNPDGVEINDGPKDPKPLVGDRTADGIPFHPYYTVGDILGVVVFFLMILPRWVFFMPEMGGYFLECHQLHPGRSC